MGKGEEDYELLSHAEVERLRKQADKKDGEEKTLNDVDATLKDTTRSIRDLKNLLGSIKRQILDDYASNPNPEELLDKIIDQNTKIAKSFVKLLKRVKRVEKQQEEIIDKLNKQELEHNQEKSKQKVPNLNPQLNREMNDSSDSSKPTQNNAGGDGSMDSMPSPGKSESPDFESLSPPPSDDEEKGFFKKLVGQ